MSTSIGVLGTQPTQAGGLLPPLTQTAAESARGNLSVPPQGAAGAIAAQHMQEMLALIGGKRNDGVTNANGAPELPLPLNDFSADQLALILAAVDSKIKQAQAQSAKEGIESARVQKETSNKEMLKRLAEAIEKQREAAAKAKQMKVLGWVMKTAAFVGALVAVVVATAATILTGGAAAPLLALALMGFAAASVDLASQANQEANPDAKPFTMGTLIGDGIIKLMDELGIQGDARAALAGSSVALGILFLQPDLSAQMAGEAAIASGVSEKDANTIRLAVMVTAVVITLVAMVAITIATAGLSSPGTATQSGSTATQAGTSMAQTGSTAAQTGTSAAQVGSSAVQTATATQKAVDAGMTTYQKLMLLGQLLSAGTQSVVGGAKIGQGVVAIEVAESKKEAELARAAAKVIEALLLKLQKESEEQTERLKEIIMSLDEAMSNFSRMVAAASEANGSIAKNLVTA
jgi:hypothetical protein